MYALPPTTPTQTNIIAAVTQCDKLKQPWCRGGFISAFTSAAWYKDAQVEPVWAPGVSLCIVGKKWCTEYIKKTTFLWPPNQVLCYIRILQAIFFLNNCTLNVTVYVQKVLKALSSCHVVSGYCFFFFCLPSVRCFSPVSFLHTNKNASTCSISWWKLHFPIKL